MDTHIMWFVVVVSTLLIIIHKNYSTPTYTNKYTERKTKYTM